MQVLKWLQWSTLNLATGKGGVEAHARCLARELKNLYNVEATFSQNPRDLFSGQFDVIQTHGSSIPAILEINARLKNRRPIWLQTLHGLSFERMWACGEWAWVGGYKASAREIVSLLQADGVVAVHDQFSLYRFIRKAKQNVAVCSNGYDSYVDDNVRTPLKLTEDLEYKLHGADPFWVFIGRGDDPVKNVELVKEAWSGLSNINLVCVPGAGFEDANWALRLGPLNPEQIRAVLLRARGLVVTSHYEGLPLVVLEALALGTPVIATRVGGLKTLSPEIQGLRFIGKASAECVREDIQHMMGLDSDAAARSRRALHNRQYLQTWQQVAAKVFEMVTQIQAARLHRARAEGQAT